MIPNTPAPAKYFTRWSSEPEKARVEEWLRQLRRNAPRTEADCLEIVKSFRISTTTVTKG